MISLSMMMMIIRMLYLSIVGITTADAFHVAVGVTPQQRLFRSSRTNSQLYQVSTTTTKSNTPLFGR